MKIGRLVLHVERRKRTKGSKEKRFEVIKDYQNELLIFLPGARIEAALTN